MIRRIVLSTMVGILLSYMSCDVALVLFYGRERTGRHCVTPTIQWHISSYSIL